VSQRLETLEPILDQSGIALSEIEVICYGVMSIASTRKEALDRYKLGPASYRSKGMTDEQILDTHFIGTPGEIIEKVQKLRDVGVTQCVANTFPMDSMNQMLEHVQIYGEEIIPAFS
jgi:alkanesulfonate monooxygenase SsuD/methylene tetrahydromethanopterin reductase-like flavin-dependent oxidoreductase (luciferase family)